MAYRLDLGKALGPEIARVGREQIATCRACLADPGGVHEARKGLKRLRALLALAAPAIGRKSASCLSRTCRNIARTIAARRDTADRSRFQRLNGAD